MNNIDLNTITIAEAKAAGVTGINLIKVLRNPVNSVQTKKNEEFAADLEAKTKKTFKQVARVKRSIGPKKLEDIKNGFVAEVEQYTTVKLDSTVINSFIRWNDKTSNEGQVWIKPDCVQAFQQANPGVVVGPFDPSATVGATPPYVGGGLVKNISRSAFNEMVANITA